LVFTGPGNNGGDGWAIARLLADQGYGKIQLYRLQISHIISADAEINRKHLFSQGKIPVTDIRAASDFPFIDNHNVIIDALFGSGLSRPLEGLSVALVKHINASGCRILSIDIPSGLMGEDNTDNPEKGIIKASVTLTFQFPKRSFFYADNEKFTGRWFIIPIGLHPGIIAEQQTSFYYTAFEDISGKIKKRRLFSHKGTYGHALLIAGSHGMMGAAILAARACIRTGAGLLTSHIPRSGYPMIQSSIPESIFSIDDGELHFANCPPLEKYSAIGVGCGIGVNTETASALEFLIKSCDKPLVVDADALNIIAGRPEMLRLLPKNTIITPHPGEFDRLAGESGNAYKRNQQQIELSKKHGLIIILKGAYTSITLPDGRCYFNSTGNPGMATAGCGDILTGMVLSLLAQGYPPSEAAIFGTFIHGLAGDLSACETGQQALIASDVINNIGNAFNKLENHERSVWY
jgi:NAD(P)H-hydrate epimerase